MYTHVQYCMHSQWVCGCGCVKQRCLDVHNSSTCMFMLGTYVSRALVVKVYYIMPAVTCNKAVFVPDYNMFLCILSAHWIAYTFRDTKAPFLN